MADEQNEDDTWLYGSSNNAEQDESKDEALDSQKASDSDTNLQTEENTDAEQHVSSISIYLFNNLKAIRFRLVFNSVQKFLNNFVINNM